MNEPFVKVSTHVAGLEAWYWVDRYEPVNPDDETATGLPVWTPELGPPTDGHWALTHTPTDRCIGDPFVSLHAALHLAHKLDGLANWLDWRLDSYRDVDDTTQAAFHEAIRAAVAVDTVEAEKWIEMSNGPNVFAPPGAFRRIAQANADTIRQEGRS